MFTEATLIMATDWKSSNIPSLEEWLLKLRHFLLLNKLSDINKFCMGQLRAMGRFQKEWTPFMNWCNMYKSETNNGNIVSCVLVRVCVCMHVYGLGPVFWACL